MERKLNIKVLLPEDVIEKYDIDEDTGVLSYKGVTLRYSVCYHGRKEKGAHTPFTAPYFAFVRLGWVFTRFFACSAHRAFSAAVSAEEKFAVLFLYSAVIYTQWV